MRLNRLTSVEAAVGGVEGHRRVADIKGQYKDQQRPLAGKRLLHTTSSDDARRCRTWLVANPGALMTQVTQRPRPNKHVGGASRKT